MEELWNSIVAWGKDNLADWTMVKVYLAFAIAGGSLLLGQLGLSVFGLGDGDDVDPDVDVDDLDGGDGLSFLSIRGIAAFFTLFGLVGAGGTTSGWSGGITAISAFSSGFLIMLFIALAMRWFRRQQSSGHLRPENALGKTARVYLRIPARNGGKGKITVSVQGRSLELEAVTKGPELSTGSTCRVVSMITEDTFEVASLEAGDSV